MSEKPKILVVTIPNCPWCSLVKNELRQRGIEFKVTSYERQEDRDTFKASYGVKTFPQVFHYTQEYNGDLAWVEPVCKRIGGYEETMNWLKENGL